MGKPLTDDFNGLRWAKEFMELIQDKPREFIDVGLMHAWFANAIMCGYDHGKRNAEKVTTPAFQGDKTK